MDAISDLLIRQLIGDTLDKVVCNEIDDSWENEG
jgi:hypothetical protein